MLRLLETTYSELYGKLYENEKIYIKTDKKNDISFFPIYSGNRNTLEQPEK
jgi:hypothetical protein